MPRYTVRNAEGREVTFDWHGQGEPTDADMEEVFAAAGSQEPAQEKPWYKRTIDDVPELKDMLDQNPLMRKTADSVMSGGLSTAAPTMVGQAVQHLAPGVSSAIRGGAERLYGGLLKAKDATIERFPTVVQDLIQARVPISHGGRAKVVGGLKKIGAEKDALLKGADARAMVPRETFRRGLDESLDHAISNSESPVKDLGRLAKIEKELIPDEPGVLPSRADKIKSKLQAESDRGFRATKTGVKVNDTAARAKMAVSHEAKQALEAIEPKLKGVNAAYASGKGQAQALRETLKRTDKHSVIGMNDLIGAGVGSAVGGPLGGGAGVALTKILGNANAGSRVAIGMNEISKIPHLDQVTKAALLAALREEQ